MGRRSGEVDRRTTGRSLSTASAGRPAGRREIESARGGSRRRRRMTVGMIAPLLLGVEGTGEDFEICRRTTYLGG